MVVNPIAMLSPEQQKLLTEVQKYTKDIFAVIKKEGDNSFSITLNTNNPQAESYLPQIRDSLINSMAQTLYTFFNIQGRIES